MKATNVMNEELKNIIITNFNMDDDKVTNITLETIQHKNGGYGKAENDYTYSYSYVVKVIAQGSNDTTKTMSFEFSSLEDLLVWVTE